MGPRASRGAFPSSFPPSAPPAGRPRSPTHIPRRPHPSAGGEGEGFTSPRAPRAAPAWRRAVRDVFVPFLPRRLAVMRPILGLLVVWIVLTVTLVTVR